MPETLSEPRLSAIIEGVETTLVLVGRTVRVIVTATALQESFGAGEEPGSWLVAFEANADVIERAARQAGAATSRSVVVLQSF